MQKCSYYLIVCIKWSWISNLLKKEQSLSNLRGFIYKFVVHNLVQRNETANFKLELSLSISNRCKNVVVCIKWSWISNLLKKKQTKSVLSNLRGFI